MPFTLIKGTFHVVGRSPDGDTLAFKAKKKAHWKKLSGRKPRFNMGGKGDITSLRFESIDTLETHYSPGKGMQIHQPQPEADEATDFSLKAAKIRDVVWGMKNDKRTRIKSAKDGTEGYILSRTVERFGRPGGIRVLGCDTSSGRIVAVSRRLLAQTEYQLQARCRRRSIPHLLRGHVSLCRSARRSYQGRQERQSGQEGHLEERQVERADS